MTSAGGEFILYPYIFISPSFEGIVKEYTLLWFFCCPVIVLMFSGVDPWCLVLIFLKRGADITVLSAPGSTSILTLFPLMVVLSVKRCEFT